ncbi:MAG: ATP-binding protein [Candidatus Kapaibacteriales bacterium]
MKKLIQKWNQILSDNSLSLSKVLDYLYSQIETPIYLIDYKYKIQWGNHTFKQMQQNQDGTKCYKVLSGFEQPCPNCLANFVISKGSPQEWISPSLLSQQNYSTWQVYAIPLKSRNSTYSLCFAIPFNITLNNEIPLKKLDYELDNEFLLQVFDCLNIGVVVLDSNLKILQVNKSTISYIPNKVIELTSLPEILSKLEDLSTITVINAIISKPSNSFVIQNNGNKILIRSFSFINKRTNETNYLLLFSKENPENLARSEFLWDLISKNPEKFNEAIFAIDSLGNLRFANSRAFLLLNSSQEDLNHSVINKAPRVFLEKIYNHKDSDEFTYETFDKEELKRTYKVNFQRFTKTDNGEHISIFIANELTGLITIENELNEIKSLLKLFSRKFNGLIVRFSPNYNIINIFGNTERIFQHKLEDLIAGKVRWFDFIHPEDRNKVEENYNSAKYFPHYKNNFEYRFLNGNDEIWVEEYLENVTDDRGKINYLQSIIYDITQRKNVEKQLKNSQEEMRNLALYFESLREEEKKKLAFEIHDELGHVLTAMKLELSWLIKKKHLREEVLHERLRKTIDLIETTLRKVRSISSQLRPSVLDHFGIVAAIEWQALEFQKITSIRCRLFLTKEEISLDEQRAIAIFRIFQEILTNVARHSKASRVDVHLEIDGNNLILTVSDNGKGIRTEDLSAKRSLGIVGMKERANAINGKLSIHGVANIGTTVTLTIPLS